MKIILAFIICIYILYNFFKKRIESLICLLIVALVHFELTLGSKVLPLYQIISVILLLGIIFFNNRKGLIFDKKIFNAALIFILSLSFSALFMRPEATIIGSLQLCFDYSLFFFITSYFLKDFNDIKKLIKGIHFGVFLVAFIGFIGYIIGDPFFGFQEYNSNIISSGYFDNISDYNDYSDKSLSLGRVSFAASDPNSLGVLMVFGLIISFHLIKSIKSSTYKKFIYFSIILFSLSIILTGSRTSIIILLIFILVLLFQNRKNALFNIFSLLFLTTIIFYISKEYDLLTNVISRIENNEQLQDGNGRVSRWTYHFNMLNLEYLLFGNSHTGHQGSLSTMSHMNYLALIYRGGLLTFFSFLYLLFRLLNSKKHNVIFPFISIGLMVFVAGISQELVNSYGPNFVIWPALAILSFSSQYFKNANKNSSHSNLPQQKTNNLR